MSACEHSLSICPDCEGLVVTEWTLIATADEIEMPYGIARNVEIFIAPIPKPCDKPQPPTA